jgi:hypothetical protein
VGIGVRQLNCNRDQARVVARGVPEAGRRVRGVDLRRVNVGAYFGPPEAHSTSVCLNVLGPQTQLAFDTFDRPEGGAQSTSLQYTSRVRPFPPQPGPAMA